MEKILKTNFEKNNKTEIKQTNFTPWARTRNIAHVRQRLKPKCIIEARLEISHLKTFLKY